MAFLAILALYTDAFAQAKPAARALVRVAGVVTDSIHGGPLVGAVVRVSGTDRRGTTDDRGHYAIDSVAPGVHRFSLYHPLLDTLGTIIETKELKVPAGRITILALATPSPETMLRIACPQPEIHENPAALLGVVRDPDTRAPAVGAQVSLTWTETVANKQVGVRRTRRFRTAVVDSAGNYAICGLPVDLGGTLQATRDGASTAGVEISIDEFSILGLRSLSLGASEEVLDSTTGFVRTLRRGPASLRGRVVGPDGAAVVGAQVELDGTPQTATTAAAGAFSLSNLPAGTQAVLVRMVGFSPSATIVELSAKTPRDVTIALNSVQILAPIEAQAAVAAGLERVGFVDRQRTGFGRFVTRDDIEKRRPFALTDLFTMMPGVRMGRDSTGQQTLESSRSIPGAPGNCVSVFVDRLPWSAPLLANVVTNLNTVLQLEQVSAIEVYQPSEVPGEFSSFGRQCLTIVIWTRLMAGDRDTTAR